MKRRLNDPEEKNQRFRIHPTYDRVLVEFDEQANKTAGGLFIPQSASVPNFDAVVIAVGPGRWNNTVFERTGEAERIPMTLKPGDKVKCPPLNFPIVVDGHTVYFVNEDEVLGLRG